MKWEMHKIEFTNIEETIPLKIIGDGSLTMIDKFDGKMIPAIIFDKDQNPALSELIRVHQYTEAGDIFTIWKKPKKGNDYCELIICFKKPIILNVRIIFIISHQFNLLYLILRNKALYLIPGTPGNKMIHVLDSPKILAEISRTAPIEEWDKFLLLALRDSTRFGHLSKKQRLEMAQLSIEKMKDIADLRKKNA